MKNRQIRANTKCVIFDFDGCIAKTDDLLFGIYNEISADLKMKTGARGLRSIIENILMDTMFELPSEPDIAEVIINEDVVLKGSKPLMVHEKKTKEINNSL